MEDKLKVFVRARLTDTSIGIKADYYYEVVHQIECRGQYFLAILKEGETAPMCVHVDNFESK